MFYSFLHCEQNDHSDTEDELSVRVCSGTLWPFVLKLIYIPDYSHNIEQSPSSTQHYTRIKEECLETEHG